MGWQKTAGIILGGGWGQINPGRPKILEEITVNGKKTTMANHIFEMLEYNLGLSPIYIVKNGHFGKQIQAAFPDYRDIFVTQEKRTGTAGALKLCLPLLKGVENILVIYGDMPCWRPRTIANLLESHIYGGWKKPPVISMYTVKAEGRLEKYGRILRNSRGKIVKICEPYELTFETCGQKPESVNPSLWAMRTNWLQQNIGRLQPHFKNDGHFGEEEWLPDLVPMAVEQNEITNELGLYDHNEALGADGQEELQELRKYLKNRKN
jgi:bifunctional UDP-N-acetylglucosamine pyrophosphorylase / glucosamine-1-phosphate N-acetyltransferase